ncbi:EAL domain-containing protein [Rheinheimera aquimaris]|uniref:EAL domain-containing protein n=1 Tax=Rheinheimera aquimaris TaxID=412437 RepID=A0ABP3NYF0_9GAMM|nr:EAL domain-containing protein [Rheinheimera aquimaris]MCB5213990.1 EAL domain-containing protein [Rheinheimera aquimaris]
MERSLLIVDDEVGVLNALSRLLIRNGYTIKTANSAEKALAILKTYACKVILTDFRMPDNDGAALLALVRRQYPDIVALVISGYADFSSVRTLLNAGTAFKFLEKPWREDELLAEIELAFQHYEQHYFQKQTQKMMFDSTDAFIELSSSGQILCANPHAKKLLGRAEDINGKFLSDFVEAHDKEKVAVVSYMNGDSVPLTLWNSIELEVSCQLEGPTGVVLLLEPVAVGALINTIFDLPTLLDYRQLVSLIERQIEARSSVTLVALKVRSFDMWSSILGYNEAECALELVAEQLLTAVNKVGSLAFLANEQFVMCFPNLCSEMQVIKQISEILDYVRQHCNMAKRVVDFAVNYCLMPEDGNEPRAILNNLLLGNVMIAESSVRMFIRYDRQAVERKRYQLSLSQALHHVIRDKQLFLCYQPKFDLLKNSVSGGEALLRWRHPDFGMVSPSLFIPLAEQHGQIIDIGYWVLRNVFKTLSAWRDQGLNVGKMAINISGRQLMEQNFLHWVEHNITQTGVLPEQLEFELTETFLLDNFDDCIAKLKALAELGISIAIDDFGTGYSSLSYLYKLPVNVLKVDRSMVTDLDCNISTQSVLANVIRLAHDLHLEVVVEGVETTAQLDIVNRMGADLIQGYYISKPLSEQNYVKFLSQPNIGLTLVNQGAENV